MGRALNRLLTRFQFWRFLSCMATFLTIQCANVRTNVRFGKGGGPPPRAEGMAEQLPPPCALARAPVVAPPRS